jgi:competence/damage-inducible protein CinA-like protein
MPSAEIITIGTEILLGEIIDTNAQFLACALRDAGIDLYRKTTVGDNVKRIVLALQQSLERCDIVITTGGLGPTVDDPTRDAIAQAIGVEPVYHPELWEQIEERFQRLGRRPTENNRRQAYIPDGALAIENPVGTAPAFIVEKLNHVIISLPGVPREMEYLMEKRVIPYLCKHYDLHGIIKTRVLHTAGAGESQIDELIADLEELSNPTVGLAAHSGQVDVRITAKADSEGASDDMIHPLEATIRDRLGELIYGADQETLEEIALRAIDSNGWTLIVVEAGLGGNLIRRLASAHGPFRGGQMITELPTLDELITLTETYRQLKTADVGLGVAIHPSQEKQDVYFSLITPLDKQQYTRPYGGPPEYAPQWAFHHSLDMIRRIPHAPHS